MAVHVDAREYERLFRATRTLDPVIKREMRKRLRDAARIGANEAKARVRAMQAPSLTHAGRAHHGTQHVRGRARGLRSVLAANIKVQVGARDVRIIQGTAGIGGQNARGLPRRLDAGAPFLHPVFGQGETAQLGYSYFKRPILGKKDDMLVEIKHVLDDISRHLR